MMCLTNNQLEIYTTEYLEQLKSSIEVVLRERDCLKTSDETNLHAMHCCVKHGCKYNDENCPVVLGTTRMKSECSDCLMDSWGPS